jgi:uncharacterized protein (DUF2235 family)
MEEEKKGTKKIAEIARNLFKDDKEIEINPDFLQQAKWQVERIIMKPVEDIVQRQKQMVEDVSHQIRKAKGLE